MRFLGLVMAHNAETVLGKALQNLSLYCDAVYVLNDRSSDETFSIARHFPIVQNIFSIDPSLPAEEWYFPEGQLLQLLYNMAEFYQPDWIIRLDADECVEGWADLRSYLDSLPPHVSGVQCPKVSGWADREYPLMVPLMGSGRTMQGAIWRFFPGTTAGKRLHNPRMPEIISEKGTIATREEIVFHHSGWSTLQRRIDRARLYLKLDPGSFMNFGTRYDKGLLFDYSLDNVDQLIHDYRGRVAAKGMLPP